MHMLILGCQYSLPLLNSILFFSGKGKREQADSQESLNIAFTEVLLQKEGGERKHKQEEKIFNCFKYFYQEKENE